MITQRWMRVPLQALGLSGHLSCLPGFLAIATATPR